MSKIYNSSFSAEVGYILEEEKIVLVNKRTGEQASLDVEEQEILIDASKAYIKNDVYVGEIELERIVLEEEDIIPDVEVKEPEPIDLQSCDGYCGDCQSNPCICKSEPIEVEEDIQHQIDAKEFGEYLIVIGDYAEQDFEVFTGSKAQLNAHIEELHLHTTPKVYALKQLQVKTKYEVI